MALQCKVTYESFQRKFHFNFFLFWIFAETLFNSFALNLYFVNAFGAKKRFEIRRYHILLNVL